jgi:hypothetical protein
MVIQLPPVGEIKKFFPNHRKCVVKVMVLLLNCVLQSRTVNLNKCKNKVGISIGKKGGKSSSAYGLIHKLEQKIKRKVKKYGYFQSSFNYEEKLFYFTVLPNTAKRRVNHKPNTGDDYVVLACVEKDVSQISQDYRKRSLAWVYLEGSTESRTRLYRMAISIYFGDLNKYFNIFGYFGNEWIAFDKEHNYTAFLIKRK